MAAKKRVKTVSGQERARRARQRYQAQVKRTEAAKRGVETKRRKLHEKQKELFRFRLDKGPDQDPGDSFADWKRMRAKVKNNTSEIRAVLKAAKKLGLSHSFAMNVLFSPKKVAYALRKGVVK